MTLFDTGSCTFSIGNFSSKNRFLGRNSLSKYGAMQVSKKKIYFFFLQFPFIYYTYNDNYEFNVFIIINHTYQNTQIFWLTYMLKIQHPIFKTQNETVILGIFQSYFGKKTVKFQLGMGSFTGPACTGYYVLFNVKPALVF